MFSILFDFYHLDCFHFRYRRSVSCIEKLSNNVCINFFLVFAGPNSSPDNETIAKYEIMDGAPVRGMCVLLRIHFHVTFVMNLRRKFKTFSDAAMVKECSVT